MKQECQDAVELALGRKLRKGEASFIEKSVNRNMRRLAAEDPQAWRALGYYERLMKGAAAAAADMTAAMHERLRLMKLQVQANDRIGNQLAAAVHAIGDKLKPGDQQKAFSNLIAFDSSNMGRGMMSAESRAAAISKEILSHMVDDWVSTKGFMGLFQNKKGAEALERELWGESSGDPVAKRAADRFKEGTDELWSRANAAGATIGKREDWHRPQTYSQAKVAGAGKDTSESLQIYLDKQLPLLDRSRYYNEDGTPMSDDEVRQQVLTTSFDTLLTDGRNKRKASFDERGALVYERDDAAGTMSGHRVLFYKNADAYMEAQRNYGETNIWRGMVNHIERMAREIALRETFGPEYEQAFDHWNKQIALDEVRQFKGDANMVNRNESFNRAMFDFVSAKHKVVDQRVSDAGQAFRAWMTATHLGSVALTAIGDEAAMSATCMSNKIPWSEVAMHQLRLMNPLNGKDRMIARHAVMGFNTLLGGISRLGVENPDMSSGVGFWGKARESGAKFSNALMKYSGAEPIWDIRRQALGTVLQSYLARTVQKYEHFSDLNTQDHGVLARKGVTEQDWQVWRMAVPEEWRTGDKLLTANSIRAIPDSRLRELGDPQTLRRNASTALLGHMLEEQGMGVMDQGARERASISTIGTQGGTGAAMWGELVRSSMLFRGFSATMAGKHWTRAFKGDHPSTAGYMARLIVIGTIIAGLTTQIANMMRGQDPDNMASPNFWAKAFLKGGGLSFYGEFLSDFVNQNNISPIEAAAGPPAVEAKEFYDLTLGAGIKLAKGKRTDEAGNLVKFARDHNPLATWYTKAAFDHFIWNDLQEAASPGYLERMQARAMKHNDTSYWWDPHRTAFGSQPLAPSRGPDMGKAWDPEKGAEQLRKIGDVGQAIIDGGKHIVGAD